MFLFIFSPILFFQTKMDYMKGVALVYFAVAMLLKPKHKTMDISKNLVFYSISALIFMGVYAVFSYNIEPSNSLVFTSFFSKFLFVVFVIGLSESFIRQGLLQRIKNPIITNGVMALGHTMSYMTITQNFNLFSVQIMYMLFSAFIAFFIFQFIASKSDLFTESLAHGIYDLQFY